MKNQYKLSKRLLTVLFTVNFLLLTTNCFSQGTAINTTGAAADPSAMLDVSSNDKGFLTPRMSEAERIAIQNPVRGLLVYQIDNDYGFWFFDGSGWVQANAGDNLGDHTATDSLNMTNKKIVNLATCTQNLDAANKEYVDNAVGAGGGGATLADTTYMLCGSKLLPVAYGGTTYTVPAGKMWSIESAVHNTSYLYPVRISSINGVTYNYGYIGNYSYSGNNIYCIATPYVLPSGTTVTFNVGNGSSHRGLVSIKEYKIVVQ
jgi:hypothetical protein